MFWKERKCEKKCEAILEKHNKEWQKKYDELHEKYNRTVEDYKESLRKNATDKKQLIDNVVDYGQRKITFELPKVDENVHEGVIFRYNGNVYAVVMENGKALDFREI